MALSSNPVPASSHLLCAEDGAQVASWNGAHDDDASSDVWSPACGITAAALVDRCGLASLLAAEADHMPRSDSLDAAARHDAVKWILTVNEFHRFRAVTAYLAINYLDRFLSSHSLPASCDLGNKRGSGGRGWPMQLLSVACVSVAAKMEESRVPVLVDLQILNSGYVFDPRTVCRMELLLMAALGWRMRAVTPFDFLPHLASSPSYTALLSRAADLVLCTLHVVDFLQYRPSAMAAAAVLCAADEAANASAGAGEGEGGALICLSDDWVNMEVVSRCRQLMEDYLINTCPSSPQPKDNPPYSALETAPRSPVAVLDSAAACDSCDSAAQTQSAAAADDGRFPPLRPEPPPPKRRRPAVQ